MLAPNPARQFGVVLPATGVEHRKMPEVGSVETSVSRQQPIRLADGVCSNQKIRCYPGSQSSPLAVSFPYPTSFECSFQRNGAVLHSQALHRIARGLRGREETCHLGPHNLAGNEAPLGKGMAQCLFRAKAKRGVAAENIEQHARVHGSDHSLSAFPRSNSKASSVEQPRFRIPKAASTGSPESDLVTSRWPRCSSISKTWPGRIPSLNRNGLGMVTCPFSETIVFILLWYEFLLFVSSQGTIPNARYKSVSRALRRSILRREPHVGPYPRS